MLKVEFFHDVICSFCYPMSYRMREIVAEMPDLEVKHRSFVLARDGEALAAQFGSHEGAKNEIITHWQHANQNDTLHRFNIEGMRHADFLFPTSMKGLKAAKAGENQGKYWDVFDKLQHALFTLNLNIDDQEVIDSLVKEVDLDFDQWKKDYESEEVSQKVEEDLRLAAAYGLHSVPALVVEGQYLISGAQPKEVIINTLNQIKAVNSLKSLETTPEGESCNMVDGKWVCD